MGFNSGFKGLKVNKIWFKIFLQKVTYSGILLLNVWVKNKTN